MNPTHIFLYLLLATIAIINFVAGLADSPRKRLKLSGLFSLLALSWYAIWRVVYGVGFWEVILFFALGVSWPLLFANLVVQWRATLPVARARRNKRERALGVAAAIALMLLVAMMMTPNRFSASGGEPIYDQEYLQSRLSFVLLFFPMIVLFLRNGFVRPVILQSGIVHYCQRWLWSDFAAYTWGLPSKDQHSIDLVLRPRPFLFLPEEIRLQIEVEDQQKLEELLSAGIRF